MAKGTVPDSHPLLLGMPGFWGLEATNDYARDADVVLALGTRFAETDASSWDPDFTWRFPPVAADPDRHRPRRDRPQLPGRDRRRGRRARSRSRRSPARSSRARRRRSPARAAATITAARARAFAAARERGAASSSRCGPQRILADLRAALPADAVLVTDVGWNKNGVAQCYELPAAGPVHHPGRRVHDGLRARRGGRRPDRLARPGRRRAGRRRRHERPAAGRPDGGRAGAAGDLRGHEQPRPRHDRRPAGSELRRQLRVRVPRSGRAALQPGLRRRWPGRAAPTATPVARPDDLRSALAPRHCRAAPRRPGRADGQRAGAHPGALEHHRHLPGRIRLP